MQQQITRESKYKDNEQSYKSIRLTEATANRLQKRAIKFGDSYQSIIDRLLNYVEGKDTSCGEQSW